VISPSNPLSITWTTAKNHFPGLVNTTVYSKEELLATVAPDKNGSGSTPKGYYPGGAMYRFDAAPWKPGYVIMTMGSPSDAWTPALRTHATNTILQRIPGQNRLIFQLRFSVVI